MLTFEGFVEQTQRAGTVAELKSVLRARMIEEGYENYIFAAISRQGMETASWQAFPSSHFETYLGRALVRGRSGLSPSRRATRPFRWKDAAPDPPLGRARSMLDECKRIGVHAIIVTPFEGQDGRSDIVG